MKKSFLGLIALCSIAGTASAQTSLSIYGVVDAGIAYEKDAVGTTAGKTWRLQSGQQSGSRIGFKGSEDLGGGLTGIFTLENGFNIDDGTLGQSPAGTTRLFGRQAWVGLTGGFGSVKLGRQQTPLYFALLAVDPFAIGLAGNAQRMFGYGLYGTDPLSRSDNTITYATPNIAGFVGTLGYGFGEQPGNRSAGRQAELGLSYVNGPINLQFAYHDANTLALPANTAFTAAAGFPTGTVDYRTAFLGGSFDLGVAKAHAGFADSEAEATAGAQVDNRTWLVGVSAPVGPGTVMASFIRNDNRNIGAGESDQVAVGYTHALSKRTNLYTSYSRTENDPGVRLNAFAPGVTGTLFNIGVRHQF